MFKFITKERLREYAPAIAASIIAGGCAIWITIYGWGGMYGL